MTDILGWRATFGVVTPSTNTVVQPEYDAMRPIGVTNHVSRMHIPDDPIKSDKDFDILIQRIDVALEGALDRVLTARPDHLILGISAESIWGGGSSAAAAISQRVRKVAGDIPFTQAADALPAALKAYKIDGPIALLTPYFPVAEPHLRDFINELGYDVAGMCHLRRSSPVDIAHTSIELLRNAITELNTPDVAAIVQFGANLPFGQLAAHAEGWLGKPVIAINTATYWHALRSSGFNDRSDGFGRLLSEF